MSRDGSSNVVPARDPVHERAVRDFGDRYGAVRLASVVVVIAAYNEDEAVGGVLDEIQREACGLPVDVLVVDDGSADRTAEVSREHGAYVASLEENRGQGSALRVGYELARENGARYIVTLDADGQWDPANIARVLAPVVRGEADFVLGSRVLGGTPRQDSLRRAGVHVFALLVRLLTGVRVTDTSSGIRAMLAEVTSRVPQIQPQYQASELLIGAICHGYRVAEEPVIMRRRAAGETKKGNNIFYGLSYARVILSTWLRQRRARQRISPVWPPDVVRGESTTNPAASLEPRERSGEDRSEVQADAR
jgi:glycosyltransferase involved in cell wall biosynthesis